MAAPFADSWYSVNHGKRRLQELEVEINRFKEDAYELRFELNADGSSDVLKAKRVKPFPDVAGVAADTINALRSSLDQAGHAVAVAKVGPANRRSHAQFPFGCDLVNAQSNAEGSKELPKPIIDVMIAFQPYKGGNDNLWALNELWNICKHRRILLGVDVAALAVGFPEMFGGRFILGYGPFPASTVDEVELFSRIPGTTPDYNFRAQADILLYEIDALGTAPVSLTGLLHDMAGIVEDVLIGLERAARDLKVFP